MAKNFNLSLAYHTMSTNDEVKVEMPPENDENELDTSPQEHDGISKPAGSSEEEIVDDATSLPQDNQIDEPRIKQDFKKLYRYASDGNWKQANREIFKSRPKNSKCLTAKIHKGSTTLHVAVAENHPKFAEELVKYMTKENLAITNDEGNTAFFLAAESGIHVNLAEKMHEKNADLPSIRGKGKRYPIYVAAYHGHKEMTEFLYKVKGSSEENDINELLKNRPLSDFFEDFKSLRRLVLKDDWDKAYEDFLKENKMYSIATISDRGNTTPHVAVVANSSKVELAKLMFNKNDELPKIRGHREKMLPIRAAAEQDHKQMVEFLCTVSEKHLKEGDVYPLLRSLICITGLSDVALNLLKKYSSVLDKRSYEALEVLAGTPMMSRDFANQNQE
ncbi:hypothetical protein Pint_11420 [Pistacia integerrima]|uniref:Uncharacterized protein n=1 Tax=Pistacia integerrima TaxID=434235 RepID=A0ACC0XHD2_9ROSI|nr:hypothetical protein Pint_11420 [Pistacia integerrima]